MWERPRRSSAPTRPRPAGEPIRPRSRSRGMTVGTSTRPSGWLGRPRLQTEGPWHDGACPLCRHSSRGFVISSGRLQAAVIVGANDRRARPSTRIRQRCIISVYRRSEIGVLRVLSRRPGNRNGPTTMVGPFTMLASAASRVSLRRRPARHASGAYGLIPAPLHRSEQPRRPPPWRASARRPPAWR